MKIKYKNRVLFSTSLVLISNLVKKFLRARDKRENELRTISYSTLIVKLYFHTRWCYVREDYRVNQMRTSQTYGPKTSSPMP